MEDVISSLSRLTALPLFSHLTDISSPTPFVLDIRLSMPDDWLPWLLGSVPAMILPKEWQTLPDFMRQPIGTGPYQVVRNSPNQLKIAAFDDYFGYRALKKAAISCCSTAVRRRWRTRKSVIGCVRC
jgi:SgrR family transcriptional regulator